MIRSPALATSTEGAERATQARIPTPTPRKVFPETVNPEAWETGEQVEAAGPLPSEDQSQGSGRFS